jgi:hypothetical protein
VKPIIHELVRCLRPQALSRQAKGNALVMLGAAPKGGARWEHHMSRLHIRVDEKVASLAKELAAANGQDVSNYVRGLIHREARVQLATLSAHSDRTQEGRR